MLNIPVPILVFIPLFLCRAGIATLQIQKCKTQDEAKYRCQVVDAEGKTLDFAGFSVFVKGTQLHVHVRMHAVLGNNERLQ